MTQTLEGYTLRVAIGRTKDKIVLIDGGNQIPVEPCFAHSLVMENSNLQGIGTKRRIYTIFAKPEPTQLEIMRAANPNTWQAHFEYCWRTTEAAVMLPSIEWLHSRRSGVAEQ